MGSLSARPSPYRAAVCSPISRLSSPPRAGSRASLFSEGSSRLRRHKFSPAPTQVSAYTSTTSLHPKRPPELPGLEEPGWGRSPLAFHSPGPQDPRPHRTAGNQGSSVQSCYCPRSVPVPGDRTRPAFLPLPRPLRTPTSNPKANRPNARESEAQVALPSSRSATLGRPRPSCVRTPPHPRKAAAAKGRRAAGRLPAGETRPSRPGQGQMQHPPGAAALGRREPRADAAPARPTRGGLSAATRTAGDPGPALAPRSLLPPPARLTAPAALKATEPHFPSPPRVPSPDCERAL